MGFKFLTSEILKKCRVQW